MKIDHLSNKIKLLLAAHLIGFGFIAFYRLSDFADWVRWGLLLIALIAGIAVGIFSESGKALMVYVKACIEEGRKVVWPNRSDALRLTLLVFVFVLVLSLFMWVVDSLLFWIFNDLLLRRG
jgi:preprotein translocase subunit SecE